HGASGRIDSRRNQGQHVRGPPSSDPDRQQSPAHHVRRGRPAVDRQRVGRMPGRGDGQRGWYLRDADRHLSAWLPAAVDGPLLLQSDLSPTALARRQPERHAGTAPARGHPGEARDGGSAKDRGQSFFLEEICRVVRETGGLQPPVTVPDTIQEVLLARIERLPEELQRLLQTASVLGREVPVALLRAIWKERGALDPLLRELTRLEFLSKRSGDVDSTYMFTHALTQEVVYESLSPARRAALHAAAGTALETLYVTRLEEVTDRLAHHYSRTDQADKAVLYLARLAEKAARG